MSAATARPTLRERVRVAIARDALLDDVRHLLVACSGGCDSVVLLDTLQALGGPRLTVLHCDHGARPEAADDAAFVAALSAARGLECRVVEAPLAPYHQGSREAGWRDLRRAAYRATAAEVGADAVALGHTADDQAETVLMNLARGCGLRGLGGMRPLDAVDELRLVRPLLTERRADLREYAGQQGLEWREDATNTDPEFTRNRLRHAVLPEIAASVPGAVDNIVRSAELLRRYEALVETFAAREHARLQATEAMAGGCALQAAGLVELPEPLAAAVAQRALRQVRGHLRGLARNHIDSVVELSRADSDGAVDLPGVRVRREQGLLRFLPLEGRRLAAAAPKAR